MRSKSKFTTFGEWAKGWWDLAPEPPYIPFLALFGSGS